ncbi:MAG: hypothetical protein Q7U71_05510 [bacterium]|nr:hypothetical protein [bacterium]
MKKYLFLFIIPLITLGCGAYSYRHGVNYEMTATQDEVHQAFPVMLSKYGYDSIAVSSDSLLSDSSITYMVKTDKDTLNIRAKQNRFYTQKGTIDLTACHNENSGLYLQSLREEIALQRGDTTRLYLKSKNKITFGTLYFLSPVIGEMYYDYKNPLFTKSEKGNHIFVSCYIKELIPLLPVLLYAPQGSINKAKPIFWCLAGLWLLNRLEGFFTPSRITNYNQFVKTGYVFNNEKNDQFNSLPMLESKYFYLKADSTKKEITSSDGSVR